MSRRHYQLDASNHYLLTLRPCMLLRRFGHAATYYACINIEAFIYKGNVFVTAMKISTHENYLPYGMYYET